MLTRNGFAKDGDEIRRLDGQEVMLWGYVDHGNLYGDESAQEILGDWWSGDGPDASTWRFNLKAQADDAVGDSFAVTVSHRRGTERASAAVRDRRRGRQADQGFRYRTAGHLRGAVQRPRAHRPDDGRPVFERHLHCGVNTFIAQ